MDSIDYLDKISVTRRDGKYILKYLLISEYLISKKEFSCQEILDGILKSDVFLYGDSRGDNFSRATCLEVEFEEYELLYWEKIINKIENHLTDLHGADLIIQQIKKKYFNIK